MKNTVSDLAKAIQPDEQNRIKQIKTQDQTSVQVSPKTRANERLLLGQSFTEGNFSILLNDQKSSLEKDLQFSSQNHS